MTASESEGVTTRYTVRRAYDGNLEPAGWDLFANDDEWLNRFSTRQAAREAAWRLERGE